MSLPIFSRIFNSANQEIGLISHGWGGVDSRHGAESKAMSAVISASKLLGEGKITAKDVARIDVEEPGSRDEVYSFTRDELIEVGKQTMASRPDWKRLHAAYPIVFPEAR